MNAQRVIAIAKGWSVLQDVHDLGERLGVWQREFDDRRGSLPNRPVVRAFLVAGIVGALGTLSAVAVDIARLLAEERTGTAIGYGAVTLVACTGALIVGLSAAGWRPAWHTMPEEDEL